MDEILDKLSEKERIILIGVHRALQGLKYGHVQLVVQDGVVVQIDRTEKVRVDKNNAWSYEI